MGRKILGTNKFIVYFYNGKEVRGGKPKVKHYAYKQWGRIWEVDENGKKIGRGEPFTNYGELLMFINKIMRKSTMKNFKEHGVW